MPTGVQAGLGVLNVPAVFLAEILRPLRLPYSGIGDGFFVYIYGVVLMWTLIGSILGVLLHLWQLSARLEPDKEH